MVTREQVQHVARLAKLTLSPEEVERLCGQLGTILDYIAQLEEVEADGAVLTHVAVPERPLRPDVPGPCLPRDVVLALAPKADGETMHVPPVLDDGGRA
jgi:aspartyl-tRNA(Asn)/glutamyl-tRNA(Gln) amidotransferase subunit C